MHPLPGRPPVRAFVAPTATPGGRHILDVWRCISYLTIELRGPIPGALRPLMGHWVFGRDACQEACPYTPRRTPEATRQRAAVQCQPGSTAAAGAAGAGRGRIPHARGTAVLRANGAGWCATRGLPAGNRANPAQRSPGSSPLADVEPRSGARAWALGRIGGEMAIRAVFTRRWAARTTCGLGGNRARGRGPPGAASLPWLPGGARQRGQPAREPTQPD